MAWDLLTNLPFDLAYKAAENFTDALQQRTRAAGFMKRFCCSGSAPASLLAGDSEKIAKRRDARR